MIHAATLTRTLLTGLITTFLLATLAMPAAQAEDDQATPKLLLMLDASGSMNEPDPSGLSKIDAAKRALTGVVAALPADSQVGLRVYGATVEGGTPTPEACADTQLVHPISALDRAGLTTAINGFTARGETPIAGSLEAALGDLGTTGKRTIILVSDGRESCVPDPCPVIQELVGAGVDLQIDTVGFGVDATARGQLQCLAEAGNGTYYDAANADELAASLAKISTRAVREFAINGTPIAGTPTPDGAPTLSAGLWVDTLTSGDTNVGSAKEHYVLQRTIPHSTMRVAVSARPTVDHEGGGYNIENIRFDGVSSEGSGCTSLPGLASRIGMTALRSVVTDSLRLDGGSAEEPTDCGDLAVPFWISRDEGSSTPLRVEILVIEEPPVAAGSTLPSPATEVSATPQPMGEAQPVVGGSSFSDAPLITPGTWTETFAPQETIFYRVHVDWGQRLELTVPTPNVPDALHLGSLYDANIYSPDRGANEPGNLGHTQANGTPDLSRTTPTITYTNREDFAQRNGSLAGDYFIEISMPAANEGSGALFPVTFRVDVTGEAHGAPDYVTTAAATPSPQAADDATATPQSASVATPGSGIAGWLPWVVGGLVVGGAIVAALVIALTRRSTA